MRSKRRRYYHKTVVVKDLFSDNTVFFCAVLIAAGIFVAIAARLPLSLNRDIVMYAFSEVFEPKVVSLKRQNLYDNISYVFPAIRSSEALSKKYAAKYSGVKKEDEAKKDEILPDIPSNIKPIDMSAKGFTFRNETAYTPDANSLLKMPLDFHAQSDSPKVLIMHTHTSEAYLESEGARSKDNTKNVVCVGEIIKNTLEKNGIGVIHDTTQNDSPSYNGSYNKALKNIEAQIEKHPSIEIVLDVHRDYAEQTNDGKAVQLKPIATVNGEQVAQVMFVVGTDARGLEHPNWKYNLAFAIQMQNKLNGISPKIARPINLRRERFNQHLTKGSLIVEVGTAGNTISECENAAVHIGNAVSSVLKEYP